MRTLRRFHGTVHCFLPFDQSGGIANLGSEIKVFFGHEPSTPSRYMSPSGQRAPDGVRVERGENFARSTN